jgi:HK97 gp10 family phage protein
MAEPAFMAITVEVKSRLRGQAKAMDETIDDLARKTAEDARDLARDSMRTPKSGRLYPGGHVASAPGQAPAIRPFPFYPTGGELFASITTRRLTDELYHVHTGVGYAKYLEYGTRHMAPRPFFRPAARIAATKAKVKGRVMVKLAAERVPW